MDARKYVPPPTLTSVTGGYVHGLGSVMRGESNLGWQMMIPMEWFSCSHSSEAERRLCTGCTYHTFGYGGIPRAIYAHLCPWM